MISDLMWHTHLAAPAAYFVDSVRLMGTVRHHKLLDTGKQTVQFAMPQGLFEEQIWKEEFGESCSVYSNGPGTSRAAMLMWLWSVMMQHHFACLWWLSAFLHASFLRVSYGGVLPWLTLTCRHDRAPCWSPLRQGGAQRLCRVARPRHGQRAGPL